MIKSLSLMIISFALILYSTTSNAHSGDTLYLGYGTTPVIDGMVSPGEWSDAQSIQVPAISGTVYFKYDFTYLYFAFTDLNYYFSTGIYLDLSHNGGSAPQIDDIWIHGSAGPFEFIGDGSSTWVQQTPSGWDYSVNQASEYKIIFSKLGITCGTEMTIGILFSFLDWSTASNEFTWPPGGHANLTNPDSWANLVLLGTTGIDNQNDKGIADINLYPNPATDQLSIESNGLTNGVAEIYNATGQLLQTHELHNRTTTIDISELESGMYFIRMNDERGSCYKKLMKY